MNHLHRMGLGLGFASLLTALIGCQAPLMHANGLPSDAYIVGGGFTIEYVAPVDGTAIWANKTTGQMLQTESLKKGRKIEVSVDPTEESVQKVIPNPTQSQLVLYFIPATPGTESDE